MPIALNAYEEIPTGYQIFEHDFSVAGASFKEQQANEFLDLADIDLDEDNQGTSLKLIKEPSNPYDENAIKVVGIVGSKKLHIGYVPAEIAEHIASTGLFDLLQPRLIRLYRSEDGYIDITMQILGLKTHKSKYANPLATSCYPEQRTLNLLRYLGLPHNDKMTQVECLKMIDEVKDVGQRKKILDWHSYHSILDALGATKAPRKEKVDAVIKDLIAQGETFQTLEHKPSVVSSLL